MEKKINYLPVGHDPKHKQMKTGVVIFFLIRENMINVGGH